MREIVLDTETTGLSPDAGHRVVEIGCLELVNHVPSGEKFHSYINPQRAMPAGAFEVHGLSDRFLSDKPLFADIAGEFCEFIEGATLIIHNAAFDLGFLNAELALCGGRSLADAEVIDTLDLARRKFPAASNSLDALCRRLGVDSSQRTRHGALLDAELLAEVYLELIGGRQAGLGLDAAPDQTRAHAPVEVAPAQRREPLPARLSEDEREAHARFVATLGKTAIWNTS